MLHVEFLFYPASTSGQSCGKLIHKAESIRCAPKKWLTFWQVKRRWALLERFRDNRLIGTRVYFEGKSVFTHFNADEQTMFEGSIHCGQQNVAETLLSGMANFSKVSSLVA